MATIKAYGICKGITLAELEDAVGEAIADGWQPYEGIVYGNAIADVNEIEIKKTGRPAHLPSRVMRGEIATVWVQAVVKYDAEA